MWPNTCKLSKLMSAFFVGYALSSKLKKKKLSASFLCLLNVYKHPGHTGLHRSVRELLYTLIFWSGNRTACGLWHALLLNKQDQPCWVLKWKNNSARTSSIKERCCSSGKPLCVPQGIPYWTLRLKWCHVSLYRPSLGLTSVRINDPLGGFLVWAFPSSKDDLTLE